MKKGIYSENTCKQFLQRTMLPLKGDGAVQAKGAYAEYWFELTWLAITIIQTKKTVPMIQNANSACQH
jgi:hypothetical protein